MAEEATIRGRIHYELLAGSMVLVPIFDEDDNVIAYETHVLQENVCAYIEGNDEVKTSRGIRVNVK